jgi:hypothetical protein
MKRDQSQSASDCTEPDHCKKEDEPVTWTKEEEEHVRACIESMCAVLRVVGDVRMAEFERMLDLPLNPEDKRCYFFSRNLCRNGDDCPFFHDPTPVDKREKKMRKKAAQAYKTLLRQQELEKQAQNGQNQANGQRQKSDGKHQYNRHHYHNRHNQHFFYAPTMPHYQQQPGAYQQYPAAMYRHANTKHHASNHQQHQQQQQQQAPNEFGEEHFRMIERHLRGPCHYFQAQGTCVHGNACLYLHDEPQLISMPVLLTEEQMAQVQLRTPSTSHVPQPSQWNEASQEVEEDESSEASSQDDSCDGMEQEHVPQSPLENHQDQSGEVETSEEDEEPGMIEDHRHHISDSYDMEPSDTDTCLSPIDTSTEARRLIASSDGSSSSLSSQANATANSKNRHSIGPAKRRRRDTMGNAVGHHPTHSSTGSRHNNQQQGSRNQSSSNQYGYGGHQHGPRHQQQYQPRSQRQPAQQPHVPPQLMHAYPPGYPYYYQHYANAYYYQQQKPLPHPQSPSLSTSPNPQPPSPSTHVPLVPPGYYVYNSPQALHAARQHYFASAMPPQPPVSPGAVPPQYYTHVPAMVVPTAPSSVPSQPPPMYPHPGYDPHVMYAPQQQQGNWNAVISANQLNIAQNQQQLQHFQQQLGLARASSTNNNTTTNTNNTNSNSPTQSASSSGGKVPCFYHRTGVCLRGDACAFSHSDPEEQTSATSTESSQKQLARDTTTHEKPEKHDDSTAVRTNNNNNSTEASDQGADPRDALTSSSSLSYSESDDDSSSSPTHVRSFGSNLSPRSSAASLMAKNEMIENKVIDLEREKSDLEAYDFFYSYVFYFLFVCFLFFLLSFIHVFIVIYHF